MDIQAQKQMFLNELIRVKASNLSRNIYTTYNLKTRVYFTITNAVQGLKLVNHFLNRFIYMHHLNKLIHLNESHYWLKPVILSHWHEYRCPDHSHGSVPLKTRITNENKPHNLQDSLCIQYSHISINWKINAKTEQRHSQLCFWLMLLQLSSTCPAFFQLCLWVWTQKCLSGKNCRTTLTYLDTEAPERDKDTRKAAEIRTSAVQLRAKLHSRLFTTFTREKLLQL